MKIKISKNQWESIGRRAGWVHSPETVRQIGSQRREKIEDTDMELAYRVSPQDVILKDKTDPRLPHEHWTLSDDYAGYVIEIDGKGYEFVSSVSAPHSGPLKDKKWGIL